VPTRAQSPPRARTPDPGDEGFEEMADVFRRRSTIANQLKLLFERASAADCAHMALAARLRWLPRYANAYREGAPSAGFYLLLEGLVMVDGKGEYRQVRPKDPPACFGLNDACSGASRTESAIAMRPSLLAYFAMPAKFASGPRTNGLAIAHNTFLHYILGRLELCRLLDPSEFDFGRRDENLRTLTAMLRPNAISGAGTLLLERGSVADSCFLLVVGEVQIESESGEVETLRATASRTPFVGAECLLRRAPSTISATSVSSDTLVLELAERHFSKLAWLRERVRRRKAEEEAAAAGGTARRNRRGCGGAKGTGVGWSSSRSSQRTSRVGSLTLGTSAAK